MEQNKGYLNQFVMNSEFVKRLTDIVEANLADENFGVEDLVREMGLSHINLHRKLKTNSNQTISQFIREIRLKKAKALLLNEDLTVSEIAYRVGFGSPTYFNKCFHEYYGYPPGEVKKKSLSIENEPNNENPLTTVFAKKESKSPGTSLIRLKSIIIVSLAFLILFSLTYFLYITFIKEVNPVLRLKDTNKSIAVLPFKNLSANRENQYFADGVMEDILNNLCHIKELKVISRASVEKFRESTKDAQEIAEKLHVHFLLEGSVQRDKDKVKVIVQLIDTSHDQQIWFEKFENQLLNIFVIQSNIAQKVARELGVVLSLKETERIEKISTRNPEAYDRYLMGRFYWNKRTREGLKKSITHFKEAIALDPEYAIGYVGLADAYYIQTYWRWIDREAGFAEAKKFVLQALKLDPNLPEAHATLGILLCWDEWKWEEARKEILIALELNPSYAIAHQYYSELLGILGQTEEALEEINIALALDPYSRAMLSNKSVYYYNQGKLEESLSVLKNLEEVDPNYQLAYLRSFIIFLRKGENLKAVEAFQKFLAVDSLSVSQADSVKEIYHKSKISGILKWQIVSELKKTRPNAAILAKYNILLGKKEESLKWLEKAVQIRVPEIPRIYTDPEYKILSLEPRFKKMINQLGLTGYPKKDLEIKHKP